MEEVRLLEAIKKRLEVMISLFLQERSENSGLSLRNQIALLNGFEFQPREIARILGTTANYVSKEISRLRKTKKSKK